MRFVRQFILLFLSLSFLGCASYFKRKQCEKTNWFTYGQGVAMRGGLLEGDPFLNECRKAEADINEGYLDQGYKAGRADYCKPATVYLTGKTGEKFNSGMCDGEPMKVLQAKYNAGLLEYCRPSNGMTAGQSGKIYQHVCTAEAERDFLPEFNKGRKKYLGSIVLSKQGEVRDIDRAIRDLENKKRELVLRLAMTPKTNVIVKDRTHTANGVHESVHVEEDARSKSVRDDIESDMQQVDYQIAQKRREQEAIRTEIRTLQTEMATL